MYFLWVKRLTISKTVYFLGVRRFTTSSYIVYDYITSGHKDLSSTSVLYIQHIYISTEYPYNSIQYISNAFHFFVLFFIRAIFKLYICIRTNCTQLIYFINNTLKHTYVLSKTLKISPTCFGHLATIIREIQ